MTFPFVELTKAPSFARPYDYYTLSTTIVHHSPIWTLHKHTRPLPTLLNPQAVLDFFVHQCVFPLLCLPSGSWCYSPGCWIPLSPYRVPPCRRCQQRLLYFGLVANVGELTTMLINLITSTNGNMHQSFVQAQYSLPCSLFTNLCLSLRLKAVWHINKFPAGGVARTFECIHLMQHVHVSSHGLHNAWKT